MEDRLLLCGVTSDASQHAHMHFKGSSALPPSPPTLPHPQHDSLLPPSYTPDSRHPSQCAQESCATTDSMNAHDVHESHTGTSNDNILVRHNFEGVELDLSLGHGGNHHELHGFLAHAITSEAVELSASSITDLDRSTNGLVAAQQSPGASFLAFKSSEATPWENTCASSTNHGLASIQCRPYVGNCDELSPTLKGHSVFQVRVDSRSQAFPFVRGALPGDGAFVASHEEKVFFCKFCDRRFHSSQALGGHQNAHKRERLVARSTPVRFGSPAFFCAVQGSMPFQLPTCRVQHHVVGASEDRPLAAHPPLQASMLVTTMCKDRFQAPPLVSSMCNSKLELDCLPSSNVYTENRSLGIKAHSLVHKPSVGQSFTPRTGHLKAMNVIPGAPGRPSATHHAWARASIDAQPGVARCFAPGQDHHVQHNSMHHDARFLLHMKDESAILLHHHHHHQQQQRMTAFHSSCAQPLVNHHSLKACINSGFLHEHDSSTAIVDLALHL